MVTIKTTAVFSVAHPTVTVETVWVALHNQDAEAARVTYRRTDFFTCGHKYCVDHYGRTTRINKCPQCGVGDYSHSMVESDEKEGQRGAEIFQPRQNPDGTYGHSILQPRHFQFTDANGNRQDVTSLYDSIIIPSLMGLSLLPTASGLMIEQTATTPTATTGATSANTIHFDTETSNMNIQALYQSTLTSGSHYTERIPEETEDSEEVHEDWMDDVPLDEIAEFDSMLWGGHGSQNEFNACDICRSAEENDIETHTNYVYVDFGRFRGSDLEMPALTMADIERITRDTEAYYERHSNDGTQ